MNLMKKILSGVLACAIAVPFSNCVFADAVKLDGINVERQAIGSKYVFSAIVQNPKPTFRYSFYRDENGVSVPLGEEMSQSNTCVYHAKVNEKCTLRVSVCDIAEENPLDMAERTIPLDLSVGFRLINRDNFKDKKATLANPGEACFLNSIMQQIHNIPLLKESLKECQIVKDMREIMAELDVLKMLLEEITFNDELKLMDSGLEERASGLKKSILDQKSTLTQSIDDFKGNFANGLLSSEGVMSFGSSFLDIAGTLNINIDALYDCAMQQFSKLPDNEVSKLDEYMKLWREGKFGGLCDEIRVVSDKLFTFAGEFTPENKVALFTHILMDVMDRAAETNSIVDVAKIYENMGIYTKRAEDPIEIFNRFLSVFSSLCSKDDMQYELVTIKNLLEQGSKDTAINVVAFPGRAALEQSFAEEYTSLFEGNQNIILKDGSRKELKGFIVSTRGTGGHYYSFVKGESGDWYCLNDAKADGFDSFDEMLNYCEYNNLHFSMAFFI